MLCATQNAWAEHLKNVVANSRRQDISQISRFITAAEWYNQHVWPPRPHISIANAMHPWRKTAGTIDQVFCSSARVVGRSKPCRSVQWHLQRRVSSASPAWYLESRGVRTWPWTWTGQSILQFIHSFSESRKRGFWHDFFRLDRSNVENAWTFF